MIDLPEEVNAAIDAAIVAALKSEGRDDTREYLAWQIKKAAISTLTAEGYMKHWRPIEEAPRYKPVWVKTESGWECVAEWRSRGCSGMCVPPGQRIHTPHLHDEWLVVNEDGDDLHPIEGYQPIHPTHYAPLLPAPESER